VALASNAISARVLHHEPADVDDVSRLYGAKTLMDGRLKRAAFITTGPVKWNRIGRCLITVQQEYSESPTSITLRSCP